MNIEIKEGQWYNNANGDTAMVSNGFQWRNYDSEYLDSNYLRTFTQYTTTDEKIHDRRNYKIYSKNASTQAHKVIQHCRSIDSTRLDTTPTRHGMTHPLRYVILVNYFEPRSLVQSVGTFQVIRIYSGIFCY